MSSYRQILYHIVFRTKYNLQAINTAHEAELYGYIWGIVKNNNCFLHKINGTEDHLHLLSDLHPSVALADYVKSIKVASSIWIVHSGYFPKFRGWAEGYGAFTYAYRDKAMIMKYIGNQKEHHRK